MIAATFCACFALMMDLGVSRAGGGGVWVQASGIFF